MFHLLWNNKFEFFDRTLLMLYYRMLGKKIILTVHNVNVRKRDSNDSFLNRISLRLQYNFCHHIFVHTERMRSELVSDFRIPRSKVSLIPFGINNTVPNTALSTEEAKQQIGVNRGDKALLFFGNIAPYKGLEYLISAFSALLSKDRSYRLIIVGRPKGSENYWKQIQQAIVRSRISDRIIQRIEYIPDELTELYFKAADVLLLPYTHVFQSGVLFLSYSFGLPVIAADVGTLREEIVEDETGVVFKPRDSVDLALKVEKYFNSELYGDLENRRTQISKYANERYSWDKVAAITATVYSNLLSV
jgi:glycosyltransferase involved in cell wall biosynthesis